MEQQDLKHTLSDVGNRVGRISSEARELTNEYTHRPSDMELRQRTIEADDGAAALYPFVKEERSELVW